MCAITADSFSINDAVGLHAQTLRGAWLLFFVTTDGGNRKVKFRIGFIIEFRTPSTFKPTAFSSISNLDHKKVLS